MAPVPSNGRHSTRLVTYRTCAVELTKAPTVEGKGKRRRIRRGKGRQRWRKLKDQTHAALEACCLLHPSHDVRAIGLWYDRQDWRVAASFGVGPLDRA